MPTDTSPFTNRKFAFLIGAPKCGTTSLANWMDLHSEISLSSKKEPGFFRTGPRQRVRNGHTPKDYVQQPADSPMHHPDAYLASFEGARDSDWLLDASTDYLADAGAAKAIKALADNNDVRLICMLRDPVKRAFSEYSHTIRDDLEPLSFRRSLKAEAERMEQHYQPLFFHAHRSRYFQHISLYRKLFGADSVLLLDISDLDDPDAVNQKISAHLDLKPEDLGPIRTLNASGNEAVRERLGRKRLLLRQAKTWARRVLKGNKVEAATDRLNDEDRDYVYGLLRDDIEACLKDPHIPTQNWYVKDSPAAS